VNTEIKKQWVEALRSGNFVQGSNDLYCEYHGTKTYCCLGVLCHILGRIPYHNLPEEEDGTEYFGQGQVLPEDIAKELGIEPDPKVAYDGVDRTLSGLNDDGISFKEIATLIENQL